MSVLEFVPAMISALAALAWPVGIVVVVFIFRRQARAWLTDPPSVLKLGPGGFEAQWNRQLSAVADAVEEASMLDVTKSPSTETDVPSEQLPPVTENPPLVAIVEAAADVERALTNRFERAGMTYDTKRGMAVRAEFAYQRGLISEKTAASVRGLNIMRNLAIHGPGYVSDTEAREFVALAEAAIYAIDQAG
ncbi:hypothetical protein [Tenggerimyces flavus]|uniref:DUF4145 domain-containing protein n=1 Tax=Tenggerimyces flavus TaxID=1708749 RepID=A0ABV7Y8C4_9ACTN|nr:hypothetical protein [Tenggerimyces flavus]MBM7783560.1 hypothetical protein [Tenggerimyces flavus]